MMHGSTSETVVQALAAGRRPRFRVRTGGVYMPQRAGQSHRLGRLLRHVLEQLQRPTLTLL